MNQLQLLIDEAKRWAITIERLIQDTDRTLILISHRFSTVRHCDRILVFENGSVVEQGSHEELVELNRGYGKLLKGVR